MYLIKLNELNNTNSKITSKDKVKLLCQNIKWGTKDFKYHENPDSFNFEDFESFVKATPNEIVYLKTFLPSNCFIKNDKGEDILNKKEIEQLWKTHNRIKRQYIYGFGSYVKEFSKYKQFYEIKNKEFTTQNTCNPLVNWTLFLNSLYNRCGISNDDVLLPIRFILPSHTDTRHVLQKDNSSSLYYDINHDIIADML